MSEKPLTNPAPAEEWRRRTVGTRLAHLFVDGQPVCGFALVGKTPFEAVPSKDLTAWGVPHGAICTACIKSYWSEERTARYYREMGGVYVR